MLKIAKYRNVLGEDGKSVKREKIDLKELKKFGFEEDKRTYTYWGNTRKIIIYKKDRRLSFNSMNRKSFDILYDLIKADLVEKI